MNLRKPLSLVAAIGVGSLALAGCSGGSSGETSDGTASESGGESTGATSLRVLTMWQPNTGEGDAQEEAIAKFQEQTGISVELVQGGQETGDVYETEYTAGDPADVVFVNLYDKTLGWTDAGVTVDVMPYLEEWGLADKVESDALDVWKTDDGKLRGFPYQGFNWPVFWNMDLLKEAGLDESPTSIDQLKALAGGAVTPFVAGGADWAGEKMFSQIIQDRIDADEAKKLFSEGGWSESEQARAGVEYFVETRDSGIFDKDTQGMTVDMMYADFNEKAAMGMSAGSWAYATTPEELFPSIELSGFPISDQSVYSKPTAYRGFSSVGFWISPAGVEKIDAVKQLIEFMYSEDTVGTFVTKANIVPAVKISDAGSLVENPLMAQSLDQLSDRVDYIVLQDTYVPVSAAAGLSSAAALAWGNASADDILKALDQAYAQ